MKKVTNCEKSRMDEIVFENNELYFDEKKFYENIIETKENSIIVKDEYYHDHENIIIKHNMFAKKIYSYFGFLLNVRSRVGGVFEQHTKDHFMLENNSIGKLIESRKELNSAEKLFDSFMALNRGCKYSAFHMISGITKKKLYIVLPFIMLLSFLFLLTISKELTENNKMVFSLLYTTFIVVNVLLPFASSLFYVYTLDNVNKKGDIILNKDEDEQIDEQIYSIQSSGKKNKIIQNFFPTFTFLVFVTMNLFFVFSIYNGELNNNFFNLKNFFTSDFFDIFNNFKTYIIFVVAIILYFVSYILGGAVYENKLKKLKMECNKRKKDFETMKSNVSEDIKNRYESFCNKVDAELLNLEYLKKYIFTLELIVNFNEELNRKKIIITNLEGRISIGFELEQKILKDLAHNLKLTEEYLKDLKDKAFVLGNESYGKITIAYLTKLNYYREVEYPKPLALLNKVEFEKISEKIK